MIQSEFINWLKQLLNIVFENKENNNTESNINNFMFI